MKNLLNINENSKHFRVDISNEKRRIRLVNSISIISFIVVWTLIVIYITLDVSELSFRIKLLSLLSVGTLLPILFNRLKMHQLAKITIASYDTLVMLIFVVLFRADLTSGHTFFLIYGLIPIFIWSVRDWPYITGFYIVNLLCFVFIEFVEFDYAMAITSYAPETDFLSGFTVLLSFVAATVTIVIFHRLAYRKEIELQSKNKHIEKQKLELENTNIMLEKKIKELTINEYNLKQANTIKGKMFSIIAHDLRSPFSSLKGLLELIVNEYDNLEEDQRRTYLESVYNTTQSTYSLLDNLLDWSRLQTNRIKVNKKPLKLIEICTNAITLNASRMSKKELDILNLIPEDLYVNADRYMLSTVFRNLISNATKYTPIRGQIRIKAKRFDTYTEISISDSGIGMSSYDIDQLFNVEKNFTKPGTDNEKGTGLGLLICKEFIELNNGELTIESEEEVGSTFFFKLENSNIV